MKCPVCSSEARDEARYDDVYLVRCSGCDHCFTDQSRLQHFEKYSPSYFLEVHKNWFENPDLSLYRRVLSSFRGLGPSAKVLDVGCGTGTFLLYAAQRDPTLQLTGIDLVPNKTTERVKFIQGDFLSYPLKDEYDAVVSFATIEHVEDVQVYARRNAELCRKGGLIAVMTINDRSLIYGAARWLNRLGVKAPFLRLYNRHHLHHFNVSSLRTLMEKNGLRVEQVLYHNYPLAAIDLPQTSALGRAIFMAGVVGAFALGRLTNRTIAQTLICRKA